MKCCKTVLFPIILCCVFCLTANAENNEETVISNTELQILQTWQAGKTVSQSAVDLFGGVERCFVVEEIPDGVWSRMQGKTYKPNPYVKRDDLRYLRLLHSDYDDKIHLGEMVCNKIIANVLIDIFRKLYEANYPIQQILLPDVYNADDETQMRANNTSCFCYRSISKSTKLSAHARGLAVDLNTLYNPYYIKRKDGTRYVQPATARKYCDRTKSFHYKIDENDLAYKLFKQHGFSWGGHWKRSKDYQHFELKE